MVSAEVELLAWPCAASAHVLFLLSKYSVASWRRLADVDGTAADFREGVCACRSNQFIFQHY